MKASGRGVHTGIMMPGGDTFQLLYLICLVYHMCYFAHPQYVYFLVYICTYAHCNYIIKYIFLHVRMWMFILNSDQKWAATHVCEGCRKMASCMCTCTIIYVNSDKLLARLTEVTRIL